MMMVCDKAAANAHARIFEPDREAVYYDSIEQAIEAIEYYLAHDEERVRIAKAGFERFWRDYEWESNLLKFLKWCESLRTGPRH
jgi:spore maturation protein CgeB